MRNSMIFLRLKGRFPKSYDFSRSEKHFRIPWLFHDHVSPVPGGGGRRATEETRLMGQCECIRT